MTFDLRQGDCLDVLSGVTSGTARCCVTSPPYYGLRDYGVEGQIGQEDTLAEYVAALVRVFAEVKRVLTDDGTLWLNLGDSYAGSWGAQGRRETPATISRNQVANHPKKASMTGAIKSVGLKPKDLMGGPWRVAFALQADGWYLRQEVIWSKPNPMPESVTDRCTKSHEHVFLLSKSLRYYFDQAAIAEPVAASTVQRLGQDLEAQRGSSRVLAKENGPMKAVGPRFGGTKYGEDTSTESRTKSGNAYSFARQHKGTAGSHGQRPQHRDGREDIAYAGPHRNARSVWTIATARSGDSHFAVMPHELARRCIAAGSAPGDTVLDPFTGSGTTAEVALELGRDFVGTELNPDYIELATRRVQPLLDQPRLLEAV